MRKISINRWIIRCFLVILALSVILSAAANLYEAYRNTIQWGSQTALHCSSNIVNLLKHQWGGLDALDQPGADDLYTEARYVLRLLCQSYDLDSLYLFRPDPQTSSRYYYVCVFSDEKKDEIARETMSRAAEANVTLQPGEQALLDGSAEIQQALRNNRFGAGYTWLAPYWNEDGSLRAIIGMDCSLDSILRETLKAFLADIVPFVLSLCLGLLILLLLVRRRIIRPIRAISDSMNRFAMDSRHKPEPLSIPYRDEIGDIASSFEKMTGDISTYVNSIEALTRQQVESDVQLELARRIQSGLVPPRTNLSGEGFCLTAMTRPAKAVGGDFYDCFTREEGTVCIVMGDVSGKGITAAIFMSMIKTVIRQKLLLGLSPAEALDQTNTEICAQNPENLFATAFVAVLNPVTGELRYANAGHNYPVLLKKEPEYLMPHSGTALGLFDDPDLKEETLLLNPGEGILLYTDGLTESVNPENVFYGKKRLLDALSGKWEETDPAESTLLRISRSVHDFCGACEPFDDMAALALFRKEIPEPPSPADPGWRSLPVTLEAFAAVRGAAFALAGDTPPVRRALLACDEWIANVVSYSGAKQFAFSVRREEETLLLAFSDDGMPYDPTENQEELADFDDLDQGGMGLSLIRQTASRMEYSRSENRNILLLWFPVS